MSRPAGVSREVLEPMPPRVQQLLIQASRQGAPLEVCGFLMVHWEIQPIRNTITRPGRYCMDAEQVIQLYSERVEEIVGVYHSHPYGPDEPSEIDRDTWMGRAGWRYWLISPRAGVTEWQAVPGGWQRLE